jgi:putative transposase
LLIENCAKYGVLIRSYVWMPNHVHLVAVPLEPDSFAKALRRANSVYAKWFNEKHGLSGYLWQDRFFSCPMDEGHFWAAMRYVERNPVRAGLVAAAQDYHWSSAQYHCFGRPDALIDTTWNPSDVVPDWKSWLSMTNDSTYDELIRASTRKGLPCGDEWFRNLLEKHLGRSLRPRKRAPKLP